MANDNHLRQRRERQFQDRVLTAIEKKPQSRLLRVLNSPLFIWLLTASFFTAGGAYISRAQQCVARSEQIIEKRQRLAREMDNRRRALAQIIENANSVDEIKKSLTSLPNTYPEFKERSLLDITSEFASLNQHIDETGVAPLEAALAQKIEPISSKQYILNFSIFMGRLPEQGYELDELKDFSRKYFEGDRIRSLAHRLSEFRPNCSASTIFRSLLTTSSAGHVVQSPTIEPGLVKEIYKSPDIIKFDIESGPGLRPPFVKFEQKHGPDR